MQKLFLFLILYSQLTAQDPLPSWNSGLAKDTIIHFVQTATRKGSVDYIEPEDRIAAFDQDGTLWVEQPVYTQLFFALDRIKAIAKEHPEWLSQEPYRTILSGNIEEMKNFSEADIEAIVAVTHAGMSVETFQKVVKEWLKSATHPRFNRSFLELTYKPMLELMRYLKAHQFRIYIVSGGGQEFIRAFSQEAYDLLPDQIIGTTGKTQYEYKDGDPILLKLPDLLFVADKQGKPQSINLFIGQKPIAAFGNSTGDQQMLEWTASNSKQSLKLLVHHDDPVREYAYGPNSKVGTFSSALMKEAVEKKWIVVSMKNDWKQIFFWQKETKDHQSKEASDCISTLP